MKRPPHNGLGWRYLLFLVPVLLVVFIANGSAQATVSALGNGVLRIMGVAAPDQMLRVEEDAPMSVPRRAHFVVTGIVPKGNWQGAVPVVVRFDGHTVLYTHMTREEFREVPPGLCAGPETLVEVDNLAASDSRVTLLGYMSE